jgi:serine/threonine protein kinase
MLPQEARIDWLTRVISETQELAGPLQVRPGKILAGLEPELTNLLLIAIARCARRDFGSEFKPAAAPQNKLTSHVHLRRVKVSSLPPLTELSGSPGSTGSVFKTVFQGAVAAAKVYHPHMTSTLRRELRTLILMSHPNIVRIFALLTDDSDEPIGFIMEFMPTSLDAAMRRMTLSQLVQALTCVAAGLADVHELSVIHSDVKPANVLISEDFLTAKLADFGFAHLLSTSSMASSSPGTRGTLLFTAPEHLDGEPISMPCDVFSFGMMSWQVFHPDVTNPLGDKQTQVIAKLLQGKRPAFTRADVPATLRVLVDACLAHEPSRRPTMAAAHSALSTIAATLGQSTGPVSPRTLSELVPAFPPMTASPLGADVNITTLHPSSPLYEFVRQKFRKLPQNAHISAISGVEVSADRISTFCDLFA